MLQSMTERTSRGESSLCCLAELWIIKVQSWQNFKNIKAGWTRKELCIAVFAVSDSLATAVDVMDATVVGEVNIAVDPSVFCG